MRVDDLNALLEYRPLTGKFFWRVRPDRMFSAAKHAFIWNKRYAGTRADRQGNRAGYLRITINDTKYYAHRIAWAMHYGAFPAAGLHIDHVDKNKANNSIQNLRCVTASDNHKNTKLQRNNTSGFVGVCWVEGRSKWMAYAKVNQKHVHLGYYNSVEEAVLARKDFSTGHGFLETHGGMI